MLLKEQKCTHNTLSGKSCWTMWQFKYKLCSEKQSKNFIIFHVFKVWGIILTWEN